MYVITNRLHMMRKIIGYSEVIHINIQKVYTYEFREGEVETTSVKTR